MLDQLELLLSLPPGDRARGIGRFLGVLAADENVGRRITESAATAAATFSDADWRATMQAMSVRGSDYTAYPPDDTVRALTAAFMENLVDEQSTLAGLEHLDRALAMATDGARVLIVGNHLSYSDTASMVHLMRRFGRDTAADRVAVLAGPKVFTDAFRRFASATVTTLKVAQSSAIAHNTAGLSPRDIAKIARRTLTVAGDLMATGRLVLLYAEGTRSRDARMQPFLKATGRYAAAADVVLPLAHHGSHRLMPVGDHRFNRTSVHLTFGELLTSADYGRVDLLEAIHERVASALPEAHRPPPDAPRLR